MARIDHWTKLGTTIRESRLAQGLSQQELAQRARVSRSWLARVEAGHRGIEFEPLLRLLSALDLSLQIAPSTTASENPPVTRSRPSRQDAWGLR